MNISKSDLETQIIKSFEKLSYTPRGNQKDIVYSIVNAFLNKKKKNVVIDAPTGVGKSLIGAVVSETIAALTQDNTALPSIIAMGTNSLSKQYFDSFSKLGDYQYFAVKGAANYSCGYMESQLSAVSKTADECVKSKLHDLEVDKYCNKCEYNKTKKIINSTQNLITNYTYFMISALASGHLKPRKLHILDEAHTLSDWFCSYAEIVVSVDLIDKYIKELGDCNGKCDNEIAGLIMLKQKVSSSEVGDNNYKQCLEILLQLYNSIASVLGTQSTMLEKVDIIKSAKYDKMSRKYIALGTKITDLFDNEYDHVFDNSIPNTFTIKPIFVGKMMNKLLTDYNLFMSATITDQYAFEILDLNPDETEIIRLDPVFPPENKPIFLIGKMALNYNTMKDPETIDTLRQQIRKIVEFHDGQKGLVLVPSFYLGNQLSFGVKYTRVFEHKSGVNLSELIADFKRYRGSSILVSPSIYEGLDLPESSFQIMAKAPWASLGDKRIAYIADNYPKIYEEITLLKLIQGAGRSVRSPTDTAATYMLDPAIKKLFNSKQNTWRNQFLVYQ